MSGLPTNALVPRFNDAKVTARWIFVGLVPIIILTIVGVALVPKPEPALLIAILGAGVILGLAIAGILWIRLPRVPPR